MAMSLERFTELPVDINRVVRMLLVHDIGEIDTGDTIFFAETGWEGRKAAELNAVKRILVCCPKTRQQVFLRCGRSLSSLKLQKRFSLTPLTELCPCC
jgi:putative hydrolase of HD superfamily